MWGISIPINLYTVLAVLFAPVFFLMLATEVPWVAALIILVVVALVARRRAVRRRRAEAEARAVEAERRAWAEEFFRQRGEPPRR